MPHKNTEMLRLNSLRSRSAEVRSPDKIRKALSEVHTAIFEDIESKKTGKMESALSKDAKKIFKLLNIKTERLTKLNEKCCV